MQAKNGINGSIDTNKTKELAIDEAQPRRKLPEEQRELKFLIRSIGTVGILDHHNRAKVQKKSEEEDSANTAPYELLLGQVTIVATFRHNEHVVEGYRITIADIAWDIWSWHGRDRTIPAWRKA
jgi:hypothetical protein